MLPAGDEKPVPLRDDLLLFVAEMSSERVMVLDGELALVFKNDKAGKFLDRYPLPEEILTLARKILTGIASGKAVEMFPGQISFHKEIGGRNWLFRIVFREGEQPLVGIYFNDETVSGRFDMNALRTQYHLTRRESDVLRHLLDGAKNLEIAEELAITEQTVKDHLSSLYRKAGVPDRFALLRLLVLGSKL